MTPVTNPQPLNILQLNVRKSWSAQFDLVDWAVRLGVDVIALQEISSDTYSSLSHKASYHLMCDRDAFETHETGEALPMVCFYISNRLRLEDWEVTIHSNYIISVTIQTSIGSVAVHNLYNWEKRIDITNIVDLLQGSAEHHILVGDFNLHHIWWGGIRAADSTEPAAEMLFNALEGTVDLLTPPGIMTWEKTPGSPVWGTIDLTFATKNVSSRCVWSQIREDLMHGSDHYPIRISVDLSVAYEMVKRRRRRWEEADEEMVKAYITGALARMGHPILKSKKAVDDYIKKILQVLKEATGLVPLAKQPTRRANPAFTPAVKQAHRAARKARSQMRRRPTQENKDEYRRLRAEARRLLRNERRRLAESRFADATISNLYHSFRYTKKLDEPRPQAHMPPQVYNGVTITDEPGKAQCLRETLFREPVAVTGPLEVDLPPADHQHFSLNRVKRRELDRIFRRLKRNKATMDEDPPNECLKLCKDILMEPFGNIFNACMELRYYPEAFRLSITIALRKPGKTREKLASGEWGPAPYSLPKNWRPISLLCCMGKMLDSIISQRLAQLICKHQLLPETQMGFSGKSTETALTYITNIVQMAWKQSKAVSLMGLGTYLRYLFLRFLSSTLTHSHAILRHQCRVSLGEPSQAPHGSPKQRHSGKPGASPPYQRALLTTAMAGLAC